MSYLWQSIQQSRLTMVLMVATKLACATPLLQANESSSVQLDDLQRQIAAIESKWQRCSVEVIETKWDADSRQATCSAQHYIYCEQRYREHRLGYPEEGEKHPQLRLRQWDGAIETEIVPFSRVDRRDRPTRDRPPGLPYEVLLNAVGFDGSLAQFLDPDLRSVLDIQIVLFDAGADRIGIKRMSRLPNVGTWHVIELELQSGNGFSPKSVRGYDRRDATAESKKEVTLEVKSWDIDENRLRYDVLIRERDTAFEDSGETWTQRVRGEKLDADLSFEQLRIRELMGNPMIRLLQGNELVSEAPFHPADQPSAEPWPVFERWLLINNILLGVPLLLYLLWLVAKVLLRGACKKRVPADFVALDQNS